MKKIIGYSAVYLLGLLCIIGMMFRVDSLDNKITKGDEHKSIYVLNK